MKTYWDALLRPARQRVWRWAWSINFAWAVALNVWAAISSLTHEDRGMWWIVNAGCAVLLVLFWLLFLMPNWMREDANLRARQEAPTRVEPFTESIPIIPSSEATDPRVYAMMRAWETGEPMSIYRDDDGVWRDSATDEILPVQGESEGER